MDDFQNRDTEFSYLIFDLKIFLESITSTLSPNQSRYNLKIKILLNPIFLLDFLFSRFSVPSGSFLNFSLPKNLPVSLLYILVKTALKSVKRLSTDETSNDMMSYSFIYIDMPWILKESYLGLYQQNWCKFMKYLSI